MNNKGFYTNTTNPKNEYARTVCLFLAEQLRAHQADLNRCAEIAEKVLQNMNLIDTEADFLRLVLELERDFHELHHLVARVSRNVEVNKRVELEKWVREFATIMMPVDLHMAKEIMEYAGKNSTDLHQLAEKFPLFKKYLIDNHHEYGIKH